MPTECSHNTDPLKLVREGTSQEQRLSPALDPASAPVDEHTSAHGMLFAQAYSKFLKYYDSANVESGDWHPFFSEDVSAVLAVAVVEDVQNYRQQVKEFTDYLNDRRNEQDRPGLRDRLDFLFSSCATLAIRLDQLAAGLPAENFLAGSLRNLIQGQLSSALKRLIAYRKGGEAITVPDPEPEKLINDSANEKAAPFRILGLDALKWSELATANLSKDWTKGAEWGGYFQDGVKADPSVYGPGTTVFEQVNHLATHNLFTSVFDQFLKVYARTVSEAQLALERTLTNWDRHEPHYALFLAYLRLFEYARSEANTLTGRHLDFYYREVLRLKEKPAEPGHAHLLVELAKQAPTRLVAAGELFKAGKDSLGIEAFFASDRDFVANQARVAALKTIYRHSNEPKDTKNVGRLYASPVSNSADGLGAPLTSIDQSWHPFYNKIYTDGTLAEIKMPEAEVGFAIASHYLLMAEGTRTVTVKFKYVNGTLNISADDIVCFLTSEKGWMEILQKTINNSQELIISLSGADPAVTAYSAKVHEYDFSTNLPILLVITH